MPFNGKASHGRGPIMTRRNRIVEEDIILTGAGAAAPVNDEANATNDPLGAVVTRSGVGVYAFTMRNTYSKLVGANAYVIGSTAGLRARITSVNTSTGAVGVTCEVNATATDAAAGDKIYISLKFAVASGAGLG